MTWFLVISSVLLLIVGIALTVSGMKNKGFNRTALGIGVAALGILLTNLSLWFALAVLLGAGGLVLLLKGLITGNGATRIPGIVLVVLSICVMIVTQTSLFKGNDLSIKHQNTYDEIEAEYLGRYVRDNYAGKRVGVLLNYTIQDESYVSPTEQKFIAAFEKGLETSVEKIQHLPILYKTIQTDIEQKEVIDGRAVNSFSNYEDAIKALNVEVVLNLSGFPYESDPEKPEFSSMISSTPYVTVMPNLVVEAQYVSFAAPAIKKGKFIAVLLKSKRRNAKDSIPDNLDDAFNARFVLLDKNSYEELSNSGSYKSFFQEEEKEKAE